VNQNQRRVLIAVIVVIAAMLAFPPYEFAGPNGVVYNEGYGWLFDPPEVGVSRAAVNVLMLLVQWLAVLIVGGLAFFITRGSPAGLRDSSAEARGQRPSRTQSGPTVDDTVPTGVGGWLLLLVAQMLVLGPLFAIGGGYGYLTAAEYQFPALASDNDWKTLKLVVIGVSVGIAMITIYGGWGLARGSDWSAVKRAKAILWIIGPGGLLGLGTLLAVSGESVEELVSPFIASVATTAIWTAYLSKSKRVSNTYIRRN